MGNLYVSTVKIIRATVKRLSFIDMVSMYELYGLDKRGITFYTYINRGLNMSDAELLIEEIKTLSADRVSEVLDFVEFIKQKENRTTGNAGSSWFEKGEACPACAEHRDINTGVLRFNAETHAAIEEGRAMMRGEIPAKWYNSLEEMLTDLDE